MKKDKLLFSILIRIILSPLYLATFVVPKNNKIWIFGCRSGKYYKDNTKYLFEFVSKTSGYRAIWLTRNKNIFKKLNKQEKKCFYMYSVQGIYYSLIAKFIFISYSYDDVGYFSYLFPLKTKIVQLYHGTPLKRLEIEKNRSAIDKFFKFVLESYTGRKFDLMFSASEIATQKFNKFFNENKKKYIISGYPRNDAIFETNTSHFLENIGKKITFKRVVFYLPTYREYPNDKSFNLFDRFGFSESRLDNVLKDNNAIFLIKLHPNEYEKSEYILKKLSNSKRIIIVADEDIESDIYPILSQTDVLITDYSSVYIDFLLRNRPIIFSAFDRKEYEGLDRGFYFDYDEITPGPKVDNWDDLCNVLEKTLQVDDYQDKRKQVNEIFNRYSDGKNSERIFNYLKNR
ncbi:MAG: CDP-glycerol:poly(Glycerophosphate)glycerophosphotransferase [Candidatus Moranbacteria bacterium GW2011_GWE1_36_7]|nr:MAG: CDP-glycerol:poly(Glycerophosphate)glycerophosphotransferase [Candidatus Moranbacteria bacterium GW2011_GWD2_36_12]KKQ06692.1 MAG: CDP-glycerol:poly(Glycerophosphate)glycerophosphotransferase [Candidatus Moranbacteria bacterium GW2011_GWE2_36_40]KKQ14974.1 MAG: CDP-glycerol:poly(Glycerophosphate)glycerophosphotransferase [Candidatus Moranbacteria bacterium GW2011_GWE1_36_7]